MRGIEVLLDSYSRPKGRAIYSVCWFVARAVIEDTLGTIGKATDLAIFTVSSHAPGRRAGMDLQDMVRHNRWLQARVHNHLGLTDRFRLPGYSEALG
jgi:hypothetical protein